MERNCGKEDGERGMRLDRRVKYRKYGEYTYLRNTALHREYLMNDTAFDLLRILSEYPGCTEERLFEELEKQYEAEDEETFRREILEFLRELRRRRFSLGNRKRRILYRRTRQSGRRNTACGIISYTAPAWS